MWLVLSGRFHCVGKNYGLMEIRIATAKMVQNFDLAFAPGENGAKLFSETKDYFTSTPGPLNVILTRR